MKWILIVYIILCWDKPTYGQKVIFESVCKYESFYRAGSSMLLLNVFNDPLKYGVDPSFMVMDKSDVVKLEWIMNAAKVKKHHQMKVNVEQAMIGTINGRDHFIIISEPNNMIIDLTANTNYLLNTKQLRSKVKELFFSPAH